MLDYYLPVRLQELVSLLVQLLRLNCKLGVSGHLLDQVVIRKPLFNLLVIVIVIESIDVPL